MGRDCCILNEKKELIKDLDRAYVFDYIRAIDFNERNNRKEIIEELEYHYRWIKEALDFLKTIEDEEIMFADDNFDYYDY